MIVLGGFDLNITFLLPLKSTAKGHCRGDLEVLSVNSLQPRSGYSISAIDHWMLKNVTKLERIFLLRKVSHSAVLVRFEFSQQKGHQRSGPQEDFRISHVFNNQMLQLSRSWDSVKIIPQTAACVIFGAGGGNL